MTIWPPEKQDAKTVDNQRNDLGLFLGSLPRLGGGWSAKKSLQPTPVGRLSSAFAVDIAPPAWLSSGKTEFMKRIGFFLILLLASGCATSPMSSAQRQFRKEHPGAQILEQTANDATEHTGYWPHSTTRRYADYAFRYRGADGVQHEEVWHYKYLNHGWSVEKEQTR